MSDVKASFTVTPTSGKSPLTVQFTNTSTGDIKSYKWSFNDEKFTTSTEKNPTFTYTSSQSRPFYPALVVLDQNDVPSDPAIETININGFKGWPLYAYILVPIFALLLLIFLFLAIFHPL